MKLSERHFRLLQLDLGRGEALEEKMVLLREDLRGARRLARKLELIKEAVALEMQQAELRAIQYALHLDSPEPDAMTLIIYRGDDGTGRSSNRLRRTLIMQLHKGLDPKCSTSSLPARGVAIVRRLTAKLRTCVQMLQSKRRCFGRLGNCCFAGSEPGETASQDHFAPKALDAVIPRYIRSLTDSYELHVEWPYLMWWELIECLRKVVLVGLFIFIERKTVLQLLLGVVISGVFIVVYNIFKPYDAWQNNVLQQVCQLSIFFTLLTALILRYREARDRELDPQDVPSLKDDDIAGVVLLLITTLSPTLVFLMRVFRIEPQFLLRCAEVCHSFFLVFKVAVLQPPFFSRAEAYEREKAARMRRYLWNLPGKSWKLVSRLLVASVTKYTSSVQETWTESWKLVAAIREFCDGLKLPQFLRLPIMAVWQLCMGFCLQICGCILPARTADTQADEPTNILESTEQDVPGAGTADQTDADDRLVTKPVRGFSEGARGDRRVRTVSGFWNNLRERKKTQEDVDVRLVGNVLSSSI